MITNPARYLLIGISFLLINCYAHAQIQANSSSITGKVIDENKDPLSYVSVNLHKAIDSSLVESAQTNEEGVFYSLTYLSEHTIL